MVETAPMEARGSLSVVGALFKLSRPRQWTKNGFVLAGLIFSGEALVASSVLAAFATFVAFCALSSSVYAFNDALDAEEDRKHPEKRNRPVASGLVSPPAALVFALGLAAAGIAVCFVVNVLVGLTAVTYLLLQVVYTLYLKHMVILDVMSISGGFVLRATAGVAAVGSPVSPWLIICTGLLTLFLGFSKRRHELAALGDGAVTHRKNLQEYTVPLLDEMMNIMLAATIIAYSIYTLFGEHSEYMMATIPFVVYGVFRYMLLVHRDTGGNPDTLLLQDRPLQVSIALFLVVAMAVIYFV
ncbi:UbiA prenyltransferase family [Rubrobacter radiotolerans]|uniref:UbiA prenyltransferase family n=2 Tax=Rubrobacter radiotolerans TaxID=42256 RepID=A0A023X3U1_RUBRA|nr:UbiA prenyltransferase family [Rubrobacter radiotolerans]SMC05995.1 4-hydroxybenzoate polyprenyltransferase [Rubrobacter radiotolerans DSM 5868]